MSIYEHYRKHEHPFVDQVISWIDDVSRTYASVLTPFLDPREQRIVELVLGKHHELVSIASDGGYEAAERRRILFYPYYEGIKESDFGLQLLESNYPKKFLTLEHRDVLGALMSLGIERKMIGDINLKEGMFQFFTTKDLVDYLKLNLTKIKNATVDIQEKDNTSVMFKPNHWKTKHLTVSSLRLDLVVKEIYHLSRAKAVQLIQNRRVKVNHQTIDQITFTIEEKDLISLRGYGRSKIEEIGGKTRKDKIKLWTAILQDG